MFWLCFSNPMIVKEFSCLSSDSNSDTPLLGDSLLHDLGEKQHFLTFFAAPPFPLSA